jgi:GNAT superfamily N-acetyltransferase
MTTDLSFRPATPDDVDALVSLVTSAYRGDASRQGWTTEADLLDGDRIDPDVLREDIARLRSRVIVAERDGRMVACAHVAEEHGAGYFGMFSVRPELQGGGTGARVLAEAERVAREEWSLPVMRMTVIDVRDELIAWYVSVRRSALRHPEARRPALRGAREGAVMRAAPTGAMSRLS